MAEIAEAKTNSSPRLTHIHTESDSKVVSDRHRLYRLWENSSSGLCEECHYLDYKAIFPQHKPEFVVYISAFSLMRAVENALALIRHTTIKFNVTSHMDYRATDADIGEVTGEVHNGDEDYDFREKETIKKRVVFYEHTGKPMQFAINAKYLGHALNFLCNPDKDMPAKTKKKLKHRVEIITLHGRSDTSPFLLTCIPGREALIMPMYIGR